MSLKRREQECDPEPQLPIGSVVRVLHVPKGLECCIYGQLANPEQLPHPTPKWYRPTLTRLRFPVSSHNQFGGQMPTTAEVVVHKRLEQHLVHGAMVAPTGDRPLVVDQHTSQPGSLIISAAAAGPMLK